MPANYTVIRDGNITLPGAGGDLDTELTFNAPGVINRSTVLSYRVNPSQDGVKFTIEINGTQVRSEDLQDVSRVLHEVVASGVVTPNGNTLRLAAVQNTGTISISDIVLLYKEA